MADANERSLSKSLYDDICADLGVKPTLDVAATKENTKCEHFITKKQNALNVNWRVDGNTDVIAYCNPPILRRATSGKKRFLQKAFNEWKNGQIKVVMLLSSDVFTTNYFWKFALRYHMAYGSECVDILPLKFRPILENDNREMDDTVNKGIFVVFFKEWRGEPRDDNSKRVLHCLKR